MELHRPTSTYCEEEIIRRAKNDPADFRPLYEKYYRQLYGYVFKKVHDKHVTGDLLSNVFTKALVNLPKYEHRSYPFSSWLYRIAINEVTDYFRRSSHVRMIPVEDCYLQGLSEEMEFDIDRYQELESHLIQAIQSLRNEDLTLIELRFFEKRSYQEISELTGLTANNAKVRTYRILKKLRKLIAK